MDLLTVKLRQEELFLLLSDLLTDFGLFELQPQLNLLIVGGAFGPKS